MKRILSIFILAASIAGATPIISDPYPGIGGDVIGDLDKFDIKQLEILSNTVNNLKIEIQFNFGPNNTNFNVFTVGSFDLKVGDILFDLGNDGSVEYGAVLDGHGDAEASKGPLITGGFYNAAGVLTAMQVHNEPVSPNYRPFANVWITQASTLFAGSTGTVTVGGGGSATPPSTEFKTIYEVTFAGNDNPLFQQMFGVSFASATCGNDVLSGTVEAVPEPASLGLAAAALAGLFFARRNRA